VLHPSQMCRKQGLISSKELPSIAKSRDASDIQDLYRRALAASWSAQPGELTADEIMEDIFAGGDGWGGSIPAHSMRSKSGTTNMTNDDDEESTSASGDEGFGGTIRQSDLRRMRVPQSLAAHSTLSIHDHRTHKIGQTPFTEHQREQSIASDASFMTIIPRASLSTSHIPSPQMRPSRHHRHLSRDDGHDAGRSSRSGSLGGSTLGATDMGFHRAREIGEFEVRGDLVAWKLPGRDL
jgi:hypothetical protein